MLIQHWGRSPGGLFERTFSRRPVSAKLCTRGRESHASGKLLFDQSDFRSPEATTGPVGCPVGEPPVGSRLIASTAPAASLARISGVTVILIVSPVGSTPIETGARWPLIIQSSKSRSAPFAPETCASEISL